jgi:hypothetical protein
VCYNSVPTTAITVTGEGVAQCGESAEGTYTVWADAPPFPMAQTVMQSPRAGEAALSSGLQNSPAQRPSERNVTVQEYHMMPSSTALTTRSVWNPAPQFNPASIKHSLVF